MKNMYLQTYLDFGNALFDMILCKRQILPQAEDIVIEMNTDVRIVFAIVPRITATGSFFAFLTLNLNTANTPLIRATNLATEKSSSMLAVAYRLRHDGS